MSERTISLTSLHVGEKAQFDARRSEYDNQTIGIHFDGNSIYFREEKKLREFIAVAQAALDSNPLDRIEVLRRKVEDAAS